MRDDVLYKCVIDECTKFKSGSTENLTNYRPISILTCFSKILEKLIYTQLTAFF